MFHVSTGSEIGGRVVSVHSVMKSANAWDLITVPRDKPDIQMLQFDSPFGDYADDVYPMENGLQQK